jgi:hypothetical protein
MVWVVPNHIAPPRTVVIADAIFFYFANVDHERSDRFGFL